MTSRISSAKNNPVLSFFKFTLKKQTPLTLLVTAFALLVCPGMILRDANDDIIRDYQLTHWDFATISFVVLGMALLLTFMLLLLNFGFLFSKKAGDMYNALPLTRNQMLVTRSVSSFIGGLFLMTASYLGLTMVNFLPTVDGVSMVTAINTYLFMLLSLIVLTAFCLLFVICSGGYFDTIIAFAAINIAPVLILALIFGVAEESATGLSFDYYQLIYLTPIAFAFYKLINLPTTLERPTNISAPIEVTNAFTVIGLIVFGLICVVAAVKLFKVRRTETAGDAYSFKFMPVIISLLVSIVGGFLMASVLTGFSLDFNMVFWFFFVACAILCAIAIGAITNRGFKNIKRSIISGVVAASLMTLMVIGGLYIAEYAENRVPKLNNIETVYIEEIEYDDNIEEAVNLHKGIIECLNKERDDNYEEFPAIINNFRNFDIKYVLKNGNIIKRNYWYRSPNMQELNGQILALMQTDSFFEKYNSCTTGESGYNYVNIHSHATKFGTMSEDEEQKNAILSEKEAKQLISIFKKEMQAANESIFSEEVYGISISGYEWQELYIPESFTETISFLEVKFEQYDSTIEKGN